MDGQGTKCRRNIAENLNRLSRAHECYRRQTDGRQHIANVNVSFAKNAPSSAIRVRLRLRNIIRIYPVTIRYDYDTKYLQSVLKMTDSADTHVPDACKVVSLVQATRDSTTAMQYWLASQPTWYAVCSRCSTRRPDSSTICDRTTTSLMRWRHCTAVTAHAARPRTRAVQAYKIAVLTFKVLHDSAGPLVAIADLPGQQALRSASTSRLVAPPIKLTTVGSRAFPVAAAQVWNGLPEDVVSSSSLQTFRRQLKAHLFQLSYPHLVFTV